MQNYKQPGHGLTLTAPSGGVTSGTGYKIGQLFAVAANDADEGDEFEGLVAGVYELPKATGTAWTEGLLLYWDDTEDEVTAVAAGNLLIGYAATAASSGAAVGIVRLHGAVAPREFLSAEQTGNGSAQNVAHGLGVVPSIVVIYPTDTAPATTGAYTQTEGTHTSTNVVVTVTSGKKYKVYAKA